MKYIFRTIRWILGQTILFADWVTRPKFREHSPEKQSELDAATANLALYQFRLCPFCVKTRRQIQRLGLNIQTRDARNDPQWNQQLINEGGKYQVPCLRIENEDGTVEWLYESNNINAYLDQQFSY